MIYVLSEGPDLCIVQIPDPPRASSEQLHTVLNHYVLLDLP